MSRALSSFIFFATIAFTNQVVKPMDMLQEAAPQQVIEMPQSSNLHPQQELSTEPSDLPQKPNIFRTIEPPGEISLGPNLQGTLNLNFRQSNMVQLEYEIDDLSNKFSSLKAPTIFDVTFVTLIFTPNQGSIEVSCILKNIAVYLSKYLPPRVSCILLNNIMLNNCSFYEEEFNHPEIISYLVEISLSTYFRQYVLTCKQCTICLKEISDQDPAILVKCGNATHEKCYNPNAKCLACGENISKDFWNKLKELPQTKY